MAPAFFGSPGINYIPILISYSQFSPCDLRPGNILFADHNGFLRIFISHNDLINLGAIYSNSTIGRKGKLNAFRFLISFRCSFFR